MSETSEEWTKRRNLTWHVPVKEFEEDRKTWQKWANATGSSYVGSDMYGVEVFRVHPEPKA